MFDQSGKYIATLISKYEEIYDSYKDCRLILDEVALILEYSDKSFRIVCCYDYGDGWNHEIIIENINADDDKNHPVS